MNNLLCFCLFQLISFSSLVRASEDVFVKWFDDQDREAYDVEGTISLSVTKGALPDFLRGDLIRLGPTIARTPKRNYTNFIDAFGRITKWQFDGSTNEVKFQSAILKSNLWNSSDAGADIKAHIMSEDSMPATRGFPDLNAMDNTDVFPFRFPGSSEYLTFTDFNKGNRIDAASLRTLGNTNFDDDVKGTYAGSHYGEYFDTSRNETIIVNWVGEPKAGGTELTVFKMGSDFRREVVGRVKIDFTQYSLHHLTMAGDHAFLVLAPVEIKFLKTGVTSCLACSAKDNLKSGTPTKILVFPLFPPEGEESPVSVIDIDETDAFFVFHHINAVLTAENQVTLDLCAYSTMDGIIGDHVLGNLGDLYDQSTRDTLTTNCDLLRRVTVDLAASKVLSVSDIPVKDSSGNSYRFELPTINPDYVLKIDLCAPAGSPTVVSSYYQQGRYLGEPIFVPLPDATGEDDGVVLVMCREGESNESRLLVLDGSDLSSVLAEVTAPFPLMFEFHGKFFPSA